MRGRAKSRTLIEGRIAEDLGSIRGTADNTVVDGAFTVVVGLDVVVVAFVVVAFVVVVAIVVVVAFVVVVVDLVAVVGACAVIALVVVVDDGSCELVRLAVEITPVLWSMSPIISLFSRSSVSTSASSFSSSMDGSSRPPCRKYPITSSMLIPFLKRASNFLWS